MSIWVLAPHDCMRGNPINHPPIAHVFNSTLSIFPQPLKGIFLIWEDWHKSLSKLNIVGRAWVEFPPPPINKICESGPHAKFQNPIFLLSWVWNGTFLTISGPWNETDPFWLFRAHETSKYVSFKSLKESNRFCFKYKPAMYSLTFNFRASQKCPELVPFSRAMTPIADIIKVCLPIYHPHSSSGVLILFVVVCACPNYNWIRLNFLSPHHIY